VQPHSFDVKLDGLAHQLLKFFSGIGRANAAGEIRNIGAEVTTDVFNDDGVLRDDFFLSNPACL